MLPPCAIKGHLYRFCLGFLRLQIWQVKSCLGTLHWNVRTFNDSPRTNVQWKVRVSMGDKNSNQTHPVVSFKTCSSESGTDLNHPHAYVQSPFHSGENPVMLQAAGILSTLNNQSCNVSKLWCPKFKNINITFQICPRFPRNGLHPNTLKTSSFWFRQNSHHFVGKVMLH